MVGVVREVRRIEPALRLLDVRAAPAEVEEEPVEAHGRRVRRRESRDGAAERALLLADAGEVRLDGGVVRRSAAPDVGRRGLREEPALARHRVVRERDVDRLVEGDRAVCELLRGGLGGRESGCRRRRDRGGRRHPADLRGLRRVGGRRAGSAHGCREQGGEEGGSPRHAPIMHRGREGDRVSFWLRCARAPPPARRPRRRASRGRLRRDGPDADAGGLLARRVGGRSRGIGEYFFEGEEGARPRSGRPRKRGRRGPAGRALAPVAARLHGSLRLGAPDRRPSEEILFRRRRFASKSASRGGGNPSASRLSPFSTSISSARPAATPWTLRASRAVDGPAAIQQGRPASLRGIAAVARSRRRARIPRSRRGDEPLPAGHAPPPRRRCSWTWTATARST